MKRLRLVLLTALLWQCCHAQQRGLFPAVLNLASMADISANATCGSLGPEMFCKLVEHVPGQPIRNAQCRICNQKSTKAVEQHPIEYAIDGTNRWWQSPSIKNGMEYHYVTITLDLKQVFQIAYMIIKAANSPRPGNWILERSIDGVTFDPWQYYAITDTECLTRFNINPRTGPPSYTRDDEVICTSFYSKIHPLENGEIHTSLINGRPSADDPSPTLLNFTSARYIRLVFQRIRTLNADLMTLTLRDPRDVDPIVTRRYYYSIKDISVGGMCICYGHAKACPLNTVTKKFSCECEHNTCGESCDRCCPGYHQQPWMAGTFLTRHVCEKCNCHGKAQECYFSQTVADLSLSLNIQGQNRGGGVCIGCRDNTAGINCQTCVAGFYRPTGVSAEEEKPCIPCSCDSHGSISQSCVPDSSQATPTGSCRCKEGFGGLQCDRCAVGYMGYPSCQRCNCSVEGSTNDDPCITPCVCKENVEGENCDRCKLGFYNLQGDNRRGCEKCSCMGVSSQCSASTWTYHNVGNTTLTGWHLLGDTGGRVWSVHRQTPPYLSVRHSDVVSDLGSAYYWNAPGLYLGNKVGCRHTRTVHKLCNQSHDIFSKSQNGNGSNICCETIMLSLYPSSPSTNRIALLPENFLVSETAQPISRRDFLSVLANVTRVMVRASYSTEPSAVYRFHLFSMQVANPSARGERRATAVESCSCPPGYAGTSCEACIPGFRRVNGNLYNGVCEACHCHGHATQCHDITGHCLDCSHHTTGPFCDTCLPGYYGNATRGSPADCQPCACPLNLPSNNFSPTCHLGEEGELLCDQCQPGYTGPRCDRCSNGYYGQPNVPGGSCQPCDCNGNLDLSISGSCDPITGQCLRCRQGYGGVSCESCADGYYGDAITAKNCQSCQCHTNGSVSEVCDKETGWCQCRKNVVGRQCDECISQTHGISTGGVCAPCHCNSFGSKSFDCDETGQCRCQPGVTGPKCDRCSRGFFNFQEGGCTPCQCSHVGNNCDANTGQCICPPNTIGERCDLCAPNHWGHDIITGCKACGCSVIGSVSQQCNVNTGCCICRDSFRGEKCNECQIGYRDFPQVTDLNGSDSQTCDLEREVCACADRTGKCSCKANVKGDNCDRCKPDTFGLSVRNPLGCSNCYCYGLTRSCTEAQGLIRMWLTLKPEQTVLPLVDKSNTAETRRGVSFQHPEILAHTELVTSTLSEPYYWKLPEQFRGSMITAYGGQLKYAVYYEARDETGPSSYEPQVIIKGGPNRNILMTRHIPGLQIGQLTRHEIDMTEIFYFCLSAFKKNLLTNKSLPSLYRSFSFCLAGSLCVQECAAGFYRLLPTAAGMGSCVQCQCSGHSSTCDPETSICQNCQDNTEGDRCERCAPGFYGVVRGFHDDCKPCACPLINPENNFSPTCVTEGFDDYRCIACPEGYEGKYCERCATGYHGNPRMPGGRCEECKCSLWGALPGPCDPVTGQCRCRVGASGKSCDQFCWPHYTLAVSKCVFLFVSLACDDECSGLLISDMDRLYRIITEVTLTTPLPPPYRVLYPTLIVRRSLASPSFSLFLHISPPSLSNIDDFLSCHHLPYISLHASSPRSFSYNTLYSVDDNDYCAVLYHYCTLPLSLSPPLVHAAGAKVKDLEDEADRLLEKLQPIKKLQDNLRRNISQIKELINQARKQANSIKVSVSSGGDCLRSYRPDIRKGRYNTIILHVKTTTPDNLLFYLGSAKYVDFLALEMRKGKVNFLWDVGSGVGRVEYPHHTIHDGNWHRIEASRNGLNGTISVYPLEGSMAGMMPTPASANSPTDYTILDVDQNAYLFVGGILGTVKKADAVRTTTFTGCMGETFLDGKPIGLWNYRERQGDCKGCVGTVQLDGEGYAAVGRPTRWNPNVSTVTFKFRTFSSESLLMYLATEDMKDFMSLELSEGKVKVNFDLGSGVGSAISANRHNDGQWKSITMSRNKKQGMSEVTLKRYAGCLREIEVSRTPYNLLSSSDYTGVTKGCNVEDSCASAVAPTVLEKAYQFGLTRNSHMSFAFDDTKVRERYVFRLNLHLFSFTLWHCPSVQCTQCSLNCYSFAVSQIFVNAIQLINHSPLFPLCLGRPEASIEDFKLNMDTPTSSHMVGRCFVATETGTYFDGTGFLKAVSSYRVGLDVSIALEFRTSRTSGVLLAISNQANNGLGLEIVEGKLLFHVDNGAGRITAEHVPEGEGFCDGQWHSVIAKKLRHRVELVVDEKQSQAESPNARSNTCDTNDPIYVGGYPDGVRQAALSTSTSFKGCLRNLKITKASKTMDVQFNKALEIKGVQPLSCPAVAA
uniref:Laminin subunit alpha-2 n=1 Tax=Sander lucioperca TaxID=283035 RepID=A0A8C9XXG1_SANLU